MTTPTRYFVTSTNPLPQTNPLAEPMGTQYVESFDNLRDALGAFLHINAAWEPTLRAQLCPLDEVKGE